MNYVSETLILAFELATDSWYIIAGENPPVEISNSCTDVKHHGRQQEA
jgi:hypothetical protein